MYYNMKPSKQMMSSLKKQNYKAFGGLLNIMCVFVYIYSFDSYCTVARKSLK